eukprot:TRINITY_DN3077_c0_g1_i1.p1 TRINITY_DN3077_c0_g1~~TRINITY_DN3077_c0_g1_i1.p1  ORF type:complete len:133 (-),score=19.41 TRINITY_DN3077_c0_g1_i1:502-900(-)
MSVVRSGMYVDDYSEFSSTLPAELQRLLSTIRELDERSDVTLNQTREQTKHCTSLPAQSSSKATAEQKDMVEKLKNEIESNQEYIKNLCTEKISLAQEACDLVDCHLEVLDEDLNQFAEDLKQGFYLNRRIR